MSVKEFVTAYGDSAFQRREEIVRCRDCRYCMSYWKSDYCDYFSHVTNDPDGFCAWGEVRQRHTKPRIESEG